MREFYAPRVNFSRSQPQLVQDFRVLCCFTWNSEKRAGEFELASALLKISQN
jgi:hypothetical protein